MTFGLTYAFAAAALAFATPQTALPTPPQTAPETRPLTAAERDEARAAADSLKVRFAGKTSADAAVAHEAVKEIVRFAPYGFRCDSVAAVEASLLPEGWMPADPNYRMGPPETRYERWEVSLCGRVEPVMVAFWSEPDAGPQFQVAHPFPAAAAPPRP
jgi:hypothetical protein